MQYRGFTLIELIVVLILVAILAITALPKFADLGQTAEINTRNALADSVRSALSIYRSNDMITNGSGGSYPAELDSNPDGSPCTSCFSTLMTHGLNDPSWTRVDSKTYRFNDGVNLMTYTYDPAAGSFQ